MKVTLAIVLCSCATLSGGSRGALECVDFIDFNARPQTGADERLGCARSVMGQLVTIREARGAEAAQQQLDAMALAFSESTFADLVSYSSGDSELRAMAALSAATAQTSRANHARSSAEQAAIEAWYVEAPRDDAVRAFDTAAAQAQVQHCAQLGPDSALGCLVELNGHSLDEAQRAAVLSQARAVARNQVASLRILPPAQQAVPLGKLMKRLRALELDEPAVREALEVARTALWPTVLEAERAGALERAAVLAEPFIALASARSAVERLRDAASSRQLAAAEHAGTHRFAAALHRHLATRFGAPATAWPSLTSTWDTSRFDCPHGVGALPASTGLQLRLVATCRRHQRESDSANQHADPSMRTFDTERSLEWETIEGTLFATCAGTLRSQRFSVRELAVDTGQNQSALRDEPGLGAAPNSALSLELQKALTRVVPECKAAREKLLERQCEALGRGSAEAFELEDALTQSALALKAWPPCFSHWLEERLGVSPPPLD